MREDRTLQARGRHVASRRHHRHPLLRGLGVGVASLLVVALAAAAVVYVRLDGNITGVDMTEALGRNRPDVVATTDPTTNQRPLNILLMGSDTRELQDSDAFTGDGDQELSEHSDTNLLVHLAANRESAFVVSIPRDSMVRRPACDDPDDDGSQGALGMFNGAFTDGSELSGVPGGALCTVRTVEANTGVPIDHFAVVNFEGFRDMVDALGGVSICLPEPIEDDATRLSLPAGTVHLDGLQATQFVRARKGIGNGSDIGRIDRQQAFLSAVVREATSSRLLLRPDRLLGFLDAATQTLTTDEAIASPRALGDLALQVRGLSPEQIRFVTVPHEVYEPDPNRVIWTDEADALWQAAREDLPLPGTEDETPTDPTSPTTQAPVLSVTPDDVTVEVVNASGTEGLARQASQALTVQGFVAGGLSNGEAGSVQGVVVHHAVADEASAQTVAAAFPGATTEVDPELAGGTVRVELGAGAPAVVEVPNRLGSEPLPEQPLAPEPGSTATPSLDARVASDASCT